MTGKLIKNIPMRAIEIEFDKEERETIVKAVDDFILAGHEYKCSYAGPSFKTPSFFYRVIYAEEEFADQLLTNMGFLK